MVKKILILAETIDTESSSAGKARNAFVSALIESDFQVKTYHYSYKEIQIPNTITKLICERKVDRFYWLSRTQRVFQRVTGKNISKPLENYFGFSFTFKNDVNSMVYALRKENPAHYDLVITLSKGASYRTHAALLKLPKWHQKWLAYIHDPYPFHWYPSPYEWSEAGYKQKEQFFIKVAEKAKWLGYPSQLLAEWMGGFNSLFINKAVILPHQMRSKNSEDVLLPSFFKNVGFTVIHAGNLLGQRNPFPLLEAWKFFLKRTPEAAQQSQLLLIGPASYHEPKLSQICQKIPSVFKSEGYVAYEEVKALEQAATVNVILEAVANESPFLPAKFPGLVQANRMILHLGPQESESRRLLGSKYQYVAEANEVQKITDLLIELFAAWKAGNELLLKREDLAKYFSAENLGKNIQQLFQH